MRRKDREITNFNDMLNILKACTVCRIGLNDNGNVPYIVPLNFGLEVKGEQITFYFHGAPEGHKMDLIRQNDGAVSFEMDTDTQIVAGRLACDYTCKYHSVMGKGKIEIINDTGEKMHALRQIVTQYANAPNLAMSEEVVKKTCVMKLTVTEWTCKES